MEPFKAIALFTPGGDVAYCKDANKQKHWHVHLCSALQESLYLSETPHFLLHGYKATVDVHWDPVRHHFQIVATAMPAVFQYRGLLNQLFQIPGTPWQVDRIQEDLCEKSLLEQYRREFPQLWEFHDLMIPVMQRSPTSEIFTEAFIPTTQTSIAPYSVYKPLPTTPNAQTKPGLEDPPSPECDRYILRLFIAHKSASTEIALRSLHRVLGRSQFQPYTLQVIDISKHPEQAERDQVTVTPTLLRIQPQPTRRIVGNLENDDQLLNLLVGLDLPYYA